MTRLLDEAIKPTSGYGRLLAVARRHSRVSDEAADLLHDALLVAAEQGRLDLDGGDRAWVAGVIANLAVRRARDAARRRTRERAERPGARPPPPLPGARWLATLPPSARTVAALAINGMSPDEIRHVLGLSDAAYRQRLTTIRKAWRSTFAEADDPPRPPADLDFGLIRRALLEASRRRGAIGAHDPDGNLFLISTSHPGPPREPPGEAGA